MESNPQFPLQQDQAGNAAAGEEDQQIRLATARPPEVGKTGGGEQQAEGAEPSPAAGTEPLVPPVHLAVVAVAGLLVAGGVWAWLSYHNRPGLRFERGLAALREGERLREKQQEAEAAKRFEEVRKWGESLEQEVGYGPHASLLLGAAHLRAGRPDRAVDELQFAWDHPDTRVAATTLLGEAYYKLNDIRRAQIVLNRVVTSLDKDYAPAHRWLAVIYFDLGAMSQALYHLEQVARLDPNDPRPHRTMAYIRKDFGNGAGAIEDYLESLRRDPNQVDRESILMELAGVYHRLHQDREALETLSKLPPSAAALALTAECHYSLGNQKEARKFVEEALKLEPHYVPAMLTKAAMLTAAGEHAQAAELLEAAVERTPKEFSARYALAQAYLRLGRKQEADEHMKVVRELKENLDLYTRLVQQSIDEPGNAQVRFQLGTLAMDLGMEGIDENWFKAALAIEPGHAEARQLLEKLRAERKPTPQTVGGPPKP
jgi:tetratricopeptide (TPR) repeat protein